MTPRDPHLLVASPAPGWRLTRSEIAHLGAGLAAVVSTVFGVGFLAPFGTLALEYGYRNRNQLFSWWDDDEIQPEQAWTSSARPVPALVSSHQLAGFDLLGLLDRLPFREQQITVIPRLTRQARAAGLRTGDPVPIALVGRSSLRGEGGLIVPAQMERPLTIALPRDDYAVLALASPRERLFRVAAPYVQAATAKVARQRAVAVDIPLLAQPSRLLSSPPVAVRDRQPSPRLTAPATHPVTQEHALAALAALRDAGLVERSGPGWFPCDDPRAKLGWLVMSSRWPPRHRATLHLVRTHPGITLSQTARALARWAPAG